VCVREITNYNYLFICCFVISFNSTARKTTIKDKDKHKGNNSD